MAIVSRSLSKLLLLSFELLKALESNDNDLAYELKEKLKIYHEIKKENLSTEQHCHTQHMKEHILANLIQRERHWIEELWASLEGKAIE